MCQKRTYRVVTSRSRMCLKSDDLRALARFCHLSASAAFTWWHWWPALGDGVAVSVHFVCTFRVSVVVVSSVLSGGRELGTWHIAAATDRRHVRRNVQ